jgi:RNA recognition motif-containing protein
MFKIYVGNLDYKVKIEQLRELFVVYAPIEDLVIPTDPKTNRAKGFAIVMIRDVELGQAAVKAMQGKRLMGRTLVVNEAVKRKKSATPPTKSDAVRNGPFGPRMNRFGDPRSGGGGGARPNRNPRRMGSFRGTGSASAPAAPAPPSSTGPGPTSGTQRPSQSMAGRPPQAPRTDLPNTPGVAKTGAGGPDAQGAGPVRAPVSPSTPPPASGAGPTPPQVPTPPQPVVPAVRPKAQKLASPKKPPSSDHG